MGLMATAVGKDVIAPMVQDIMQAALKVHLSYRSLVQSCAHAPICSSIDPHGC